MKVDFEKNAIEAASAQSHQALSSLFCLFFKNLIVYGWNVTYDGYIFQQIVTRKRKKNCENFPKKINSWAILPLKTAFKPP